MANTVHDFESATALASILNAEEDMGWTYAPRLMAAGRYYIEARDEKGNFLGYL